MPLQKSKVGKTHCSLRVVFGIARPPLRSGVGRTHCCMSFAITGMRGPALSSVCCEPACDPNNSSTPKTGRPRTPRMCPVIVLLPMIDSLWEKASGVPRERASSTRNADMDMFSNIWRLQHDVWYLDWRAFRPRPIWSQLTK